MRQMDQTQDNGWSYVAELAARELGDGVPGGQRQGGETSGPSVRSTQSAAAMSSAVARSPLKPGWLRSTVRMQMRRPLNKYSVSTSSSMSG